MNIKMYFLISSCSKFKLSRHSLFGPTFDPFEASPCIVSEWMPSTRVTRWVCKKITQDVHSPTNFCHKFFPWKFFVYLCNFRKIAQMGENSPNRRRFAQSVHPAFNIFWSASRKASIRPAIRHSMFGSKLLFAVGNVGSLFILPLNARKQ
jgi:hypothetical protein